MDGLNRIAQRLGAIRSTIRLFFAIDWLGRTLAFSAAFLAGLFIVDFFLPSHLPLAFRMACLFGFCCFLLLP